MATISEFIKRKRVDWKQKHLIKIDKDGNVDDSKLNQFLLAGLDFLDMAKDFLDTGTRYKSRHHVWRDAAQPLSGLINLIAKPLKMIGGALLFTVLTPIMAIHNAIWGDGTESSLEMLKKGGYLVLGFLARAITAVIRGATQLATTPLTWLRMIGRGIYTAIKGWKPFTENMGTKQALAEGVLWVGSNTRDSMELNVTSRIRHKLQAKLKKAVSHGQPIDITESYRVYPITPELKNGDHTPNHGNIYVEAGTTPLSFRYMTTQTTDSQGDPMSVEVNFADLDSASQAVINASNPKEFDFADSKHQALIVKVVKEKGHIAPLDIFLQTNSRLDKAIVKLKDEDKKNPGNRVEGTLSPQALTHAKNHLRLFGASFEPNAAEQKPREACEWDIERTNNSL